MQYDGAFFRSSVRDYSHVKKASLKTKYKNFSRKRSLQMSPGAKRDDGFVPRARKYDGEMKLNESLLR